MPRTRTFALTLAVFSLSGALLAAGCGSDEGFRRDGSKIDADPATTLPKTLAATTLPAPEGARKPGEPLPEQKNVTGVSTDLKQKPKVPKPTGEPPKELQGSDVVVGKGDAVKSGDKVSVQYVGVLFSNGKEFDSSWSRKQPFEFTVGQGQVIQGWDDGLIGMKPGGRRVLVIPSDLAYGEAGSPPTIPANAPLVFVVDLEKIS